MNPLPHASPVKDGRRILGEKTPNACLSPRHTTSPGKRSHLDLPASSPKKLLPSPLFAGQKRSIDQVHSDAPVNKAADVLVRDRTEPVSVPVPESVSVPVAHAAPAETEEVMVSNESQEQPQEQPQVQPQQPEQAAQDATATETPMDTSEAPSHSNQNPEAVPEQEPQEERPQQQQQQEQLTTTQIPDPSNPESRKQFIQQKATLLRTRLQNAMRHVRDDPQFDRRLSELEEHSRKYPRLSHSASTTTNANTTGIFATPTPRVMQGTLSSSSPLDGANEDMMKTPTQKSPRRGNMGSPMELSSPVVGEKEKKEDRGLVTPAQRGDAVDGLLKLMSTGGSSE